MGELTEGYLNREIVKVWKKQGDSEYNMAIKIRTGEGGYESRWLNIHKEDAIKMALMLRDT